MDFTDHQHAVARVMLDTDVFNTWAVLTHLLAIEAVDLDDIRAACGSAARRQAERLAALDHTKDDDAQEIISFAHRRYAGLARLRGILGLPPDASLV